MNYLVVLSIPFLIERIPCEMLLNQSQSPLLLTIFLHVFFDECVEFAANKGPTSKWLHIERRPDVLPCNLQPNNVLNIMRFETTLPVSANAGVLGQNYALERIMTV